ncbi:MAG: 2Fe-2S iron-sulfur cluster binding domain-containing protein [Alphaproteobacteria bacterium]|nr:2Fe-2S iron-sulfur cluster binding domain-containing protein [Alphaproteobacteria bacterium]
MAKITFREAGGSEHTIEIDNGLSLMEGAVRNMVPGIDADCGGACSCATCMVYVPPEWADRLPAKESSEEAMLQFCPHATAESRLSCQITVSDALDGLRVTVPESQH